MKKNIITYILIILSMLILVGCKKENDKNDNKPTLDVGEPTPAISQGVDEPTGIPVTSDVTITPAVTEPIENSDNDGKENASGNDSGNTADVTKAPDKGNNDDTVSVQSALNILGGYISEQIYDIKLVNENLLIDNRSYYLFQVSSGNEVIEPLIVVDIATASINYYDERGELIDFNGFPLDKAEAIEPDSNIEASDAVSRLSELSQKALKLDKPLSEYEVETDYPWTTVVNGEQCYGVNLFDNSSKSRKLVAIYYVSVDGSAIYHLEDDYIFTKISE